MQCSVVSWRAVMLIFFLLSSLQEKKKEGSCPFYGSILLCHQTSVWSGGKPTPSAEEVFPSANGIKLSDIVPALHKLLRFLAVSRAL